MSIDNFEDLAIDYFEACDSAHALSAAIKLRYREYDSLATASVSPRDFVCADKYFRSVCGTDFLRKCADLPTTIDRKANAVQRWRDSEVQCYKMNRLLNDLVGGSNPSTRWIEFFYLVRKNVVKLVGRTPSSFLPRFGPGVALGSPSGRSLLPHKICSTPVMTEECWVFLSDFKHTAWFRNLAGSLFGHHSSSPVSVDLSEGNRFTTVPKDGKTDRGIAIEPSLNVFIQLGLGTALRSSLVRSGFLASTSQETHRKLARAGSASGELATIDLSNASDSISSELIRLVVPDEWYQLLRAARSPKTLIEGQWVFLEKFSSMGNGYTFELETIVFAAICMAVSSMAGVNLTVNRNFSVYGDDIIVPSEMAAVLVATLQSIGFSVNQEKTFLDSSFRESCGGDFFDGSPVRPIQVKELPWHPIGLFALHNQLIRVPFGGRAADRVLEMLPTRLRGLGGPVDYGDIFLHGRLPIQQEKNCCISTKGLLPHSVKIPLKRWDDDTAIASMLYGVPSDGIPERNTYEGYRVTWVATP